MVIWLNFWYKSDSSVLTFWPIFVQNTLKVQIMNWDSIIKPHTKLAFSFLFRPIYDDITGNTIPPLRMTAPNIQILIKIIEYSNIDSSIRIFKYANECLNIQILVKSLVISIVFVSHHWRKQLKTFSSRGIHNQIILFHLQRPKYTRHT